MAFTQILTKRAQVFVILESTTNTYQVQTAGTGFAAEVGDAPMTIDGENFVPQQIAGSGLSPDEYPGAVSATLSFRVQMRGSGTAGTPPEFGTALQACGFSVTNSPGASDTYMPVMAFDGAGGNPGASYSVTILEDGVAWRLRSAFGNVVFSANLGEPMYADFVFTGGYEAPIMDALEVITYDATVAPAFMGGAFAMNLGGAGTPIGVTNFTVDTGNIIGLSRDVNQTNGVIGARLTNRKSFGSFNPEMIATDTANLGYHALQRAGTAGTITTGAIGGTAGNKVTLAVARAVLRPISQDNREGIRGLEIPFGISSLGTDVEGTTADFSIAFT